ncbi:scy1-like protein [Anaeramoeba ignava]|uniref:Scy1-like protein n=1 Tax=Anaeramoeba ignava TaxID=1746090 RepID=A0A9Q0LHV1_ANAIG|nr:scy1-like protein [Anaeramoeba ignava]
MQNFEINKEISQINSNNNINNNNIFKIVSAIDKITLKNVSLIIFEKKFIQGKIKNFLNFLEKEIEKQTKIQIENEIFLKVLSPIFEEKDLIFFAIEPIKNSLKNSYFLINKQKESETEIETEFIQEFKILSGFIQLIEGMQFLNKKFKQVHVNLNPECVYLNEKMEWKINLIFSMQIKKQQEKAQFSFEKKRNENNNKIFNPFPNLDYLSPEIFNTKKTTFSSDIFSFGCLLANIYAKSSQDYLLDTNQNIQLYKAKINDIETSLFQKKHLPVQLQKIIINLIKLDPSKRISFENFILSDYLIDFETKVIEFLSKFNQQKPHFQKIVLNSLKWFIPYFNPSQINQITQVLSDLLKQDSFISVLIEILLVLSKHFLKTNFLQSIYPQIQKFISLTEPLEVNLSLIKNLDLIIELLGNDISTHNELTDFIQNSFHSQNLQIRNQILQDLPKIYIKIESDILKNKIFSLILSSFSDLNDSSLIILLDSLSQLAHRLESGIIIQNLFPLIEKISLKKDNSYIIIEIFKLCSSIMKNNNIDYKIIGNKILSFLSNLLLNSKFELEYQVLLIKKAFENVIQQICMIKKNEIPKSSFGKKQQIKEKKPEKKAITQDDHDPFQFADLNPLLSPKSKEKIPITKSITKSKEKPKEESKKESKLSIISNSQTSKYDNLQIYSQDSIKEDLKKNSPITPISFFSNQNQEIKETKKQEDNKKKGNDFEIFTNPKLNQNQSKPKEKQNQESNQPKTKEDDFNIFTKSKLNQNQSKQKEDDFNIFTKSQSNQNQLKPKRR